MEEKWCISAFNKTYDVAAIEKIAATGGTFYKFMMKVNVLRASALYVAAKRGCLRTNKCEGMCELVECFNELGLADFIEFDDKLSRPTLYYYYDGKDCDGKMEFWEKHNKEGHIYYASINVAPHDGIHRPFWYLYDISCLNKTGIKKYILSLKPTIHQWNEEDVKIKHIFDKVQKQTSIARTSVQLMVDNELKGKGYDYQIHTGESRVVVTVNIGRQRKVEIPLSFKNFQKQVGHLCKTIDGVIALSQEIPIYFKISHEKEAVKP